MSDNNQSRLNELTQSLRAVQQLRKSAFISIILLLTGVAIIIGTFIYSITKLRSLERQISQKQQKIKEQEELSQELEKKLQSTRDTLGNMAAVLAPLAEADPDLARQVAGIIAANPNAPNYRPAILIHTRSQRQQDLATQLEKELQRRGYVVSDRQVKRGPSDTQVRFFRDQEQSEAELIADLLKKQGIKDAHGWRITEDYSPLQQLPRHFEIWFGPK